MEDRRHSKKMKNRHIPATASPICIKFETMTSLADKGVFNFLGEVLPILYLPF